MDRKHNCWLWRFCPTPTKIDQSSVEKIFRWRLVYPTLRSDRRTPIFNWSTNWTSKDKLYCRLQRFRSIPNRSEFDRKIFSITIRIFCSHISDLIRKLWSPNESTGWTSPSLDRDLDWDWAQVKSWNKGWKGIDWLRHVIVTFVSDWIQCMGMNSLTKRDLTTPLAPKK